MTCSDLILLFSSSRYSRAAGSVTDPIGGPAVFTVTSRTEGFVDAMRDALRTYLRFAAARRLEWAPHLGTEKRLFLTFARDERDSRVRRASARGRPGRSARRASQARARPAVRVAGAAPRRSPRASRQGGATSR